MKRGDAICDALYADFRKLNINIVKKIKHLF